MSTIKLADFTHEAASQTKGELLKAKLQDELEKRNKICVDFENQLKWRISLKMETIFLILPLIMRDFLWTIRK